MTSIPRSLLALALAAGAVVTAAAQNQEGFTFRSGVELINVTTTVTDDSGRFVSGLQKEDFTVFEDGVRQEVTQFSNERVPVSLGIVLDTSGSMTPDKMSAARTAIDRFVYRSEERRVGKECRSRWSPSHHIKKEREGAVPRAAPS